MKNKFQTLIILLLCFGVFTTVLKPKKVEAIALSSAIAGVTAVALVGVLGYNLVMPKDKQIDVSGQLTGLFNKAKEWADGLPDWLYYSQEDFDRDLGSPTGVGTLSKSNLRGVSSMIKDYLGSRSSFYLDNELNIIDTSSLLNTTAQSLWERANGNINISYYRASFLTGQSSSMHMNYVLLQRATNATYLNKIIRNPNEVLSSLTNEWLPLSESQQVIPNVPEIRLSTLGTLTLSALQASEFSVSNIGKKAFAGYSYDSNGDITYKYQIIQPNDLVLHDTFSILFGDDVLGTYSHMGNNIELFNHGGKAHRTMSLYVEPDVNALFTVRSLQEYILNNLPYGSEQLSETVRFEKTMVIDNNTFNKNIESIPTNQNGAIAIPQVPQFETDKEIGGFPLIDDINKILDGSGSGTGSGDLPIDNTDTLPKDTSFPTYPDILPFPDLSLHNVLSTDFFAQLFAWLGSVLTSPFVWLGSVINWAVTKLVLLFQTLIKALFMPTTTIDNFINLINSKFPIIGQVSDLVSSLINGLNINSERPRFAIQYYGTHDIIDFSVVDPFIGVIKALISFLLSFRFVKWLVGYIPKLLGGV